MRHGSGRQLNFKQIMLGVGVRLIGAGFIFLGDGHTSLWSKMLVAFGLVLSVAGISVLRYMLLVPFFSKMGTRIKASQL